MKANSAKAFFACRPHAVPAAIAAAVLLGALGKWPYGYYTLLRWVTCATAVFLAFCAHAWHQPGVPWLFGFVAALFNPLVPVHLSRHIWQPIDVVTALAFLVAIPWLSQPPAATQAADNE